MPPPPPVPDTTSLLYDFGDIALYSSLPPLILFVVFYAVRSNWRETAGGRAIMWFAGTLMAVLLLAGVTRLVGQDWPLREWVRLVVYLACSVAMWRLFFTLLVLQNKPPVPEATQEDEPQMEAQGQG